MPSPVSNALSVVKINELKQQCIVGDGEDGLKSFTAP